MEMDRMIPICDNPKCRFHKKSIISSYDVFMEPIRVNTVRRMLFDRQEIFPLFSGVRRLTRNKFRLNNFNLCLTFCSDCEKVADYVGIRLQKLRVDPSLKFRQPAMVKHIILQEINYFIDDYYKEQSKTKNYLNWNEMFGNKVKFINCPIHV